MNRFVAPAFAALLLLVPGKLSGAETVSTTLNLVNEGSFNVLTISLAIPDFETGYDNTTLTGTADAILEIDPNTGVVTLLTFTGGTVNGTPITLTGDSLNVFNPGSYSFSSTALSGTMSTLNPPGPVANAPGSGDFDATRHQLTINGGVLSGLVDTLFVDETINHDFALSPVTAVGFGTGNIQQTFRADLSSQTTRVFDITVVIPVNSTSQVPSGAVTVTYGASGTLKVSGQISVPYLPEIFNFSPSPQIVANGTALNLDYAVVNADTLDIDNGVGGVTPTDVGSKPVIPPDSSDITYTLTAANGNGSVIRSTYVRAIGQGSATFQYLRFTPVRLKGDLPGFPVADSVQVADFHFFNGGTEQVAVGATNPGGSSPPGEGPVSLIDGNINTKWLDFNRAAVVFDFGSPVTINNYRFTTANDFEERDPVAWTLCGSDDQVAWTIIDTIRTWQGDPGRQFNHFTPVARQASTQTFPVPAVPVLPPPVITRFEGSPQIVLDGNQTSLGWETASADTLEIDNGVGSVTGATGDQAISPPLNGDIRYVLTAANQNGDQVQAGTWVRSVVQGSATHRFVRFTPLRLAETLPGFSSANSVQLAEFEFLNNGVPVLPVAVSNPGGNNPAEQPPENVIDGNVSTVWLDFNKGGLVFDFGTPSTISAYRWRTGEDEPPRDPVAWLLEGSPDGVVWNRIDVVDKNRSNAGEEVAFYAGLPRSAYTPLIPVPAASSLVPVIDLFVGDAPFLISGEPLLLTWTTTGAASASIDQGIGPVTVAGSVVDMPVANTTYTLTASSAAGSVTQQFSTVIVTPAHTGICYEGFDLAGDELGLLGDATIVNDFANIPLPGDLDRLRLTPDAGDQSGTTWFRKRLNLSQGFECLLDLHLLGNNNSGADGLAFIIQNTPEGTGAEPVAFNEEGLPSHALNIKFDSYLNGTEPSAGFIQVKDGINVLATADLTVIGGITLPGTVPNDLSSDDFGVAPYEVKIAYVPGDLDIFFQDVLVIDSLNVDLAAIGALDGNGKGYVGFSSRTGEFTENHDVTRWILVEGPPAPPLVITDIAVNIAADTVTLTFASSEFRSYAIEESVDAVNFTGLVTGIAGAAGAGQTTTTPISFVGTPAKFFRVVEEKP